MEKKALYYALSLALLAVLAGGCMQQYKGVGLAPISGIPGSGNTDMRYYVKGQCPEQAYVPIATVEVYQRGRYADHAAMRQKLLQQGVATGADALIVNEIETWQAQETKTTLFEVFMAIATDTEAIETTHHYWHNRITGQAIQYANNLDHLSNYIRQEQLYLFVDSLKAMAPVAKVDYGFAPDDFTINSSNPTVISTYMQYNWAYALRRILYQVNDQWRYQQRKGKVVKRNYSKNGFESFTAYDFKYDAFDRVHRVAISQVLPGGVYKKEELLFTYDDLGFLIDKLMVSDNEQVRETFQYNEAGQLAAKSFFRWPKGGTERLFMRSEYTYYTPEYAQQFIIPVNDTTPTAKR